MSAVDIVVMAGPSLPPGSRPSSARLRWLPPTAGGDIAALCEDPPASLCLIDGLFDACPAPWHKELMLLMAHGTRVFGAASMGALRAAELDRHGMVGVGAIYRAYRDGRLIGDDEVALIHATGRLNWAALTVPLVELRATLLAACRSRLLQVPQARQLRDAAARLHFSERDWPALEQLWTAEGLCDAATAAEIARQHVPLKQLDALTCIETAIRHSDRGPAPPPPPMTFFLSKLLAGRPA